MKTHLIFAHPSLESFNGQMRNAAIQTLEANQWQVTTADLYQIKFKASADAGDFTKLQNPIVFDIQKEQEAAITLGTFTADIQREQQLLVAADLIIFQFPLWWESMPALMKGYIDRVFSKGWAYGSRKALAGKKVLASISTGAPAPYWEPDQRGPIKGILRHLFGGTLEFCNMIPLEPFVAYGVKYISDEERRKMLITYTQTLESIIKS